MLLSGLRRCLKLSSRRVSYLKNFNQSLESPSTFWKTAANDISWNEHPTETLSLKEHSSGRWFLGSSLNTCYNALDIHLERGLGKSIAIIHDSPATKSITTFTYQELHQKVTQLSGVISELGISKSDLVIIYMPMVPEAIIAMLACARIGAVHSVVFGGFASNELATRIKHAKPKIILSASCGIEGDKVIPYKPLLDHAIELAADEHTVTNCLILQREKLPCAMIASRDIDWNTAVQRAVPFKHCVNVLGSDPLYVLYTSGTTGNPKGIIRDNGGHAVALKWSMKNIYGVKQGDVFWAASDVGWVVGHSYITYGPLLAGCTTLMYEGKPVGTPDAGAFWRVISQHKVNVLFTAPTAIRAIRRQDKDGHLPSTYDMSSLRHVFLAGERCDPDTLIWTERALNVPVIDHWWQTETGWPICGNPVGLVEKPWKVKHGSCFKPMPGYGLEVINPKTMHPMPPGEMGQLVIKLPLPPGTLTGLLHNKELYEKAYFTRFPGYYDTGDAGYIDGEGYVFVMARTDDVINVAGHRISSGSLEEVLAHHSDVAEAVVIGKKDELRGHVPVGLIVLSDRSTLSPEEVCRDCVEMIRQKIGAVAFFRVCINVTKLPKTRSGKILRNVLRKIADGEEYVIPPTIEDASVFEELEAALKNIKN